MTDELNDNGTVVAVPQAEPVKKARVRKPKPEKPFILPVPSQIDGTKNATLEASVTKRYKRIAFYTDPKPGAKPAIVVHDADNEKVVKNVGTVMMRFICALVEATTTGASMSGDGAAVYCAENFKTVLAHQPKFGNYIMELVPAGKAGLTSYRSTVNEWQLYAERRAGIIRTSRKVAGTKARTTRQVPVKESKEKGLVTF